MLQIERMNDQEEALRSVLDGFARGMACSLVGIVNHYDPAAGTVSVQPSIETIITKPDGSLVPARLPLLTDVPVCYLGGGSFVATFPIQPGDEALVIFADRCVDSWFQSGSVQPPADPRAHSISDGFALIGPRSLARKLQNVSATNAQLRSLDGTTHIELTPAGQANVVAPSGINLTGPVTINGNLQLNGTAGGSGGIFSVAGRVAATGEGTFGGIDVSTHVHGGVFSGGSNTTGPIG
jgi:hypothetical protein